MYQLFVFFVMQSKPHFVVVATQSKQHFVVVVTHSSQQVALLRFSNNVRQRQQLHAPTPATESGSQARRHANPCVGLGGGTTDGDGCYDSIASQDCFVVIVT